MRETVASRKVRAWTDEHSQQGLAAKLSARTGRKVHQATVSAWSRGEYVPTGRLMAALSEELGVELNEWLQPAPALPSPDDSGPHAAVPPPTPSSPTGPRGTKKMRAAKPVSAPSEPPTPPKTASKSAA